MKTASTRQIIEYLEAYEKIHGIGSVVNIGRYCSGNRKFEYSFDIKDKNGNIMHIDIPSLEEDTLF